MKHLGLNKMSPIYANENKLPEPVLTPLKLGLLQKTRSHGPFGPQIIPNNWNQKRLNEYITTVSVDDLAPLGVKGNLQSQW